MLEGLLKVNGLLGGGISAIAGLLTAVYLPGTHVSLWLFIVVVVLILWLLIAAVHGLWKGTQEARALHDSATETVSRLEREHGQTIVVAAVQPFNPYKHCACVFIVRWSAARALPIGAQVVISTAQDTHERPLGSGFVRPPQQDGKGVVTLDKVNDDAKDFVQALLDKHSHDGACQNIRIGPGYDLQNLGTPNTGSKPGGVAYGENVSSAAGEDE